MNMENYIEHEVLTINPAGAEERWDAYHIMFGADEHYVKYAGIVLTSILILDYGEKRPDFAFHICTDSVTAEDRAHLEATALKYKVPIYLHFMPENILDMLPSDMLGAVRLSKATYFRLWGLEAVSCCADTVLYLDSDMMVTDDKLVYIWDINRDGCVAAAVCDPDENAVERLGIAKYFNAGILLVDTNKWHQERFTEKCMGIAIKNIYPAHDQDVLNVVLDNKWVVAPGRYNNLVNLTEMMDATNKPQDVAYEKGKATIWHFILGGKPWIAWTQPLKIAQHYRSVVEQSAWSWDEVVLYPGSLKPRYKHYHKAARSERKIGHYGGGSSQLFALRMVQAHGKKIRE